MKGMANLNYQQAPRSLVSGGVGGRVGSGLVSGVSGHVTPTFGGPLSPGRSSGTAMPGGAPPSMASRSTLFGQRAFADRRVPIPTPLSQANSNSMSSMASLPRFNSSNYHSVFGEGGDTSTPPLLDLSEFPSLTARGAGDQAPAAAPPPPGSKPYVGMVKQPTAEQSEFTMSSEDFPALPGTSSAGGAAPVVPPPDLIHPDTKPPRKGIQTSPEGSLTKNDINLFCPKVVDQGAHSEFYGKVTNIPDTMIPNQYGIVGLLTFIRAAESDPSLVSLALGQDLTALGLNLNSPDNLYLTFAGPWADTPCRYNREWRYHMEEKVWISQAPGMPMVEKTSTYERGTYYFFDAHNWRKVAKEFHLDYSKLEGRPQLPPHALT
ncbi:regulator of gene activity-like isoform X5 [Pieris napi]|uniref:regulator of gene activity-like isoform X5 n=1 Tax=Pieris napi TaxID=78633 RepID=UPI001FBA6D8D|nr:regulator of gene activity-like isoform X5 [Pieris napi]